METLDHPLSPPGTDALGPLREQYEAVVAGQQDAGDLHLEPLVRAVRSALGAPPEDPRKQEEWLAQAGEALRLLSELCALKAERVAPAPATAVPGPAEDGRTLPGPSDAAAAGEGSEANGAEADLAARAGWFERLQAAAEALARQAEGFSLHQPRPEPSALMESLRLLGPWPDEGPGVSPDELARVLERVLRRHALAEAASRAPAPSMDWEALLRRIRERVAGEEAVELGELVAAGADRAEVIAMFLVVLELVRVGELWLVEQAGAIRVRRRRPGS